MAVLADVSGSPGVVRRYDYATFGAMTARDGSGQAVAIPADRTVFGWTGHVADPETGFAYMRHRYYSPRLGRFATQDPSGYVDGLNLYAYVNHDPVKATDPLGLWSFSGFVKGVATAMAAVAVVAVVAAAVVAVAAVVGAAAVVAVGVEVIVVVGTAGTLTGAAGAIVGVGGILGSGLVGAYLDDAAAPPTPPRRAPAGVPGPKTPGPQGPGAPSPSGSGDDDGGDSESGGYGDEAPGGEDDVDQPEGSGEDQESPDEPETPEPDQPEGGDTGPEGGPSIEPANPSGQSGGPVPTGS